MNRKWISLSGVVAVLMMVFAINVPSAHAATEYLNFIVPGGKNGVIVLCKGSNAVIRIVGTTATRVTAKSVTFVCYSRLDGRATGPYYNAAQGQYYADLYNTDQATGRPQTSAGCVFGAIGAGATYASMHNVGC